MANIDRIVKVSISLHTAGITAINFNDLLLFGPFIKPAGSNSNVFIITDPDELIEDFGVIVTDPMYKAASVFFSQIPHPARLFIGFDGNSANVADDIIAINNENSDWYGLCDVTHNELRTIAIADWIEAHEKIFVTVLYGTDNISNAGTDLVSTAYKLQNGNYFRTAWWWNPEPDQFPDVAIASKSFTKYPGQETWANQRLAAVKSTHLSETNFNNIYNKNGNTFEPFRNVNITQNGKVSGGEWIDIIRFRDWLCEEIKIRIFQQMIDNRIPYTDPGIAIIRSRLQQALDFGVKRGGIAPPEVNAEGDYVPSYIIEVPLSMMVSSNDKANRILRDVYFTARLAGAIHVVEIQGTLTYDNLAIGAATTAASNGQPVSVAA
jgi:Protein of unknown function (DUF3383)